jgi:multiple antibiotic resistance protein
MLSGEFSKTESKQKSESDAQTRNDIALTPLAIPMLARTDLSSEDIYSEHQETSEILFLS